MKSLINLPALIGDTAEAAALAGGDGSMGAKLKRLSQDLSDLAAVIGQMNALGISFQRLLETLRNPIWLTPDAASIRVNPTSGTITTVTTVTTVTTCSTVTSVSQLGAVPANSLVLDSMSNSWANMVRRQIT